MSFVRAGIRALLLALLVLSFTSAASAQPAPPRPDAGADPNVFYGATPPDAATAPVIVFVHGLRGHASDWWVGNTMYQLAYAAGYRTAFININRDLTRNDAGVTENAAVLRTLFPKVARRFAVPQFYIVAHSKGGVDVQAALIQPGISPLARAVFQISPPNHGSALADWAFGPGRAVAQTLGLLSPGVFAMQTANMAFFRSIADPASSAAGVPYFTFAGNTFLGNPLTAVTGLILRGLTGGATNDGFVTIESTKLATTYATDLGVVMANHFNTNDGSLTFLRIQAEIQRIEGIATFERIATGGFGDRHNSMAWSMGWFKGQLYVGTGRAFLCVTFATSDRQLGTNLYSPLGPDLVCAPTIEDLPLAAEIWRYSPVARTWQRVFKSPEDVPVRWNAAGAPTKFTARDMAFRGMTVFREPDGTEALYAAGVGASVLFDRNGPYLADPGSYPPPRILRSTDGLTWEPLPQTPGTFLGDISAPRPGRIQVRGFRSLHVHQGKLWVSVSDFRGLGFVIASSNPALGDDAWSQASPSADVLPIWSLETFNGWLYATTGDRTNPVGYGVWKTRGIGPGPFVWQPVVVQGGYQIPQYRSPDALSIAAFKGKLYVGTDRPTELIRINADDTWDLIVGGPRMTPTGLKRPISGLLTGFGNLFNGHFWRMAVHDDTLFLGTWDWSVGLRVSPQAGSLLRHEFGADFYKTTDGRFWQPVTKTGFNDPFNYGVRTLESTPVGLFVGTANPFYGTQVWRTFGASAPFSEAAAEAAQSGISEAGEEVPAPAFLEAASGVVSGHRAILTWERVKKGNGGGRSHDDHWDDDDDNQGGGNDQGRGKGPKKKTGKGPIEYQIHRSTPIPFIDTLPPDFRIEIPGTGLSLTIEQIRNGALDNLCRAAETIIDCEMVGAIKDNALVPGPYVHIFTTRDPYFADNDNPPDVQSLYYLKTVDRDGHVSAPSNIVGGPSAAAPVLFSTVKAEIIRVIETGVPDKKTKLRARLLDMLMRARHAFDRGNYKITLAMLEDLSRAVDGDRGRSGKSVEHAAGIGLDQDIADELLALVRGLDRNVFLVSVGEVEADALLQ
jgi:hypothetical protein